MPDFGRWTSNGGDPSLNEINRTDRFLDALANQQPVYSTDPGEAELAYLLAGWRDEVRDAPLRTAVTPRDAVLAFDAARASRRRGRMTLAVVGSVAAAVLCLGGFVSVVAGAGPGDTLYGLRTLFFGEQAPRDDAVMLASQQLAEVQQLIEQGQWEAAEEKLQTLTTTVASVDDVERKEELVTQWQELTVKVESKDANATVPPGAPLPQMPNIPAVVAPGVDVTDVTDTTDATDFPDARTSPSDTTPGSPPSDTTSPSTPPTTTPAPSPTGSPSSPIPTTTSPPGQRPSPSSPTLLPAPPPSSPLPTPSAVTPVPTPSAVTPVPTPSAVTPLPTAVTPLPTAPPRAPEPTPTAQQDEDEGPVVQRPAPKPAVTTTIVVPQPDKPRQPR